MNTALEIKLANLRHAHAPGASVVDIDKIIDQAQAQCMATWHYEDVGVTVFKFEDNSELTIFHAIVDVHIDAGSEPLESEHMPEAAIPAKSNRLDALRLILNRIKEKVLP